MEGMTNRQKTSMLLFRNGEMDKEDFLTEMFEESPDFAVGLESGFISAKVKTLD